MLKHPLHTLRILSFTDGVSLLLVLGIGSTLKRLAGFEQPVFVLGSLHGVIFVALALYTFWLLGRGVINFKTTCLVALASVIPFAPFVLDRYLKQIETQGDAPTADDAVAPAEP